MWKTYIGLTIMKDVTNLTSEHVSDDRVVLLVGPWTCNSEVMGTTA